MATLATVQANGPGPGQQVEPAQAVIGSIKRKRDEDAEDTAPAGKGVDVVGDVVAPPANTSTVIEIPQQKKSVILAYYNFLRSIALGPSVLERPLRQPPSEEEPPTKRAAVTIADKVSRGEYKILDDLVMDLYASIKDRVAELESNTADQDKALSNESEKGKLRALKRKAIEQYQRDIQHPRAAMSTPNGQHTSPRRVLKVSGVTGNPVPRPLFSSLARKSPISEANGESTEHIELPPGVEWVNTSSLNTKVSSLTLGDVFPTPKNRVPLLPTKPAASKQAQNLPKAGSREILTWTHPVLEDRTRPNTFSSQSLPCGYFIDYGASQAPLKARQRERAQSLAGHKPSTSEMTAAEHDALFRQTCLSFAPSFDNSGAIITARQAAKLHWQKYGQYSFYKEIDSMCGADEKDEDVDQEMEVDSQEGEKEKESETEMKEFVYGEIDERLIEAAIDKWEDVPVDPELLAMSGYDKTEKRDIQTQEDIDDILTEISDLILTLESMQHIRHRSKPASSTNRLAAGGDHDMLTSSQGSQSPSEEEISKYKQAEKRLVTLVSFLPPYEVAKLGGDQLNDLLVSTKIGIEMAVYTGTMEEDEGAVARRRAQQAVQQQQSPATAGGHRPSGHRPPGAAFPTHPQSPHHATSTHYAAASRTPSGPPPHYYRPGQPSHAVHQPPRPGPPQPQVPARPTPPQHRPGPNGYTPYVPQLANTQTPYGHQGMQQYTPGTRPMQQQQQQHAPQHPPQLAGQPSGQHPNYASPQQQSRTPDPRYRPGYPQGYQTQQPGTPSHPPYQGYPNGSMPQRTVSPQVPHQQQQQPYQQRFSGQHMPSGHTPATSRPPIPNQGHVPNSGSGMPGPTGFHSSLSQEEQRRLMENARAQFQERNASLSTPTRQPQVSGLAGIGLGVGPSRNPAAQRASISGGMGGMGMGSPRPMPNGLQGHPQAPHNKVSPVPMPAVPQQQRPQQMVPPAHHSPMQMQAQVHHPQTHMQQIHQQQPHQMHPQAIARQVPTPPMQQQQQPQPPQPPPQGQHV